MESDLERLARLEERVSSLADLPRRVARLERDSATDHELERDRGRRNDRRAVWLGVAIAVATLVGQVAIALAFRGGS